MAAPQMVAQTMGDLMEYTRGGPGEGEGRGATLVERHNERMQQEKETKALEKLSALMPAVGAKLRAFALAKADWEVDAALALLRSFQVSQLDKLNAITKVSQLDKLNAITKKRKRINEEIEDATEAAVAKPAAAPGGGNGGGASGSGGSSGGSSSDDSSSGSGSDSEGARRASKRKRSSSSKRRSKDEDKKRSSKDKKKKKRSSSKRDKKEKDKGKRSRKDKGREEGSGSEEEGRRRGGKGERDSAARAKANTTEFGKFGVIREADADRKRSEFMAWALDVKKVDVEALAKWEEKELFKEFVEDFNTGTLAHRKYYDLAAYEASKLREQQEAAAAKLAARQGTRKAQELGDEQELHRRRVEERKREQEKRVKEAMDALRRGGMAEEMRRQELLRAEMALAYKTGDTAKAHKIAERLAPDDPAKKR